MNECSFIHLRFGQALSNPLNGESMIQTEPQLIVIMGVSGCGKSTIGAALANRAGLLFFDGDDFHSDANRQKMSDGIPLTDEDRKPWLQAIVDFSAQHCAGEVGGTVGAGLIVACSALRKTYRDQLRTLRWPVRFVHLHAPFEVIYHRMSQRSNHYMPESLLRSQYETLESATGESDVFEFSAEQSVDQIVAQILKTLEL